MTAGYPSLQLHVPHLWTRSPSGSHEDRGSLSKLSEHRSCLALRQALLPGIARLRPCRHLSSTLMPASSRSPGPQSLHSVWRSSRQTEIACQQSNCTPLHSQVVPVALSAGISAGHCQLLHRIRTLSAGSAPVGLWGQPGAVCCSWLPAQQVQQGVLASAGASWGVPGPTGASRQSVGPCPAQNTSAACHGSMQLLAWLANLLALWICAACRSCQTHCKRLAR